MMTNTERHAAAIPLISESLRGNRDALGDLMMLFRPVVGARVYLFLVQFGMDQYTDDVVQEAFVKVTKDFRLFIPRPHLVAAGFQAWAVLLARSACLQFIDESKNRMARQEIPLAESRLDDEGELKASVLSDAVSLAAWEQESTRRDSPPPSQSRRTAPRRYYNRTHKPKEKPPPPKKKRRWNKKTSWEMYQVNRERADYLNTIEA